MNKQITSSFSTYPYFDDYDPLKFFQKILFKPSYEIQVRELNQLQTILQEQIARFGSSIFKNGSLVLGCDHKINTTCFSLIVSSSFDLSTSLINSLISGKGYVSSTQEKVSQILEIEKNEDGTVTFIVNDISEKSFSSGDTIYFYNPDSKKESLDVSFSVISKSPSALIKFNQGVIYLDGAFIQVPAQRKILSLDSSVFSGSIGFKIDKKIERRGDIDVFIVDLLLEKRDIITDVSLSEMEVKDNFIEFLRVDKGILLKDIRVPIYSELEKTLARRTYDESGNYTVKPFKCKIVENLGNAEKFSVEVSPGKAYVLGYEFDSLSTRTLDLDRALDISFKDGFEIATSFGSYIRIENFFGFFDVQKCEEITLLDAPISSITFGPGGNEDLHKIGTARVRHVKYLEEELRLYLFDIKTIQDKTFSDVKSVVSSDITKNNVGNGNLIESQIYTKENSSLLFKFPEDSIKSLRDSSNKIRTDYYIQKTFLSVVFNPSEDAGSPSDIVYGTITLPHNEQFILNPTDFIVVESENSSYIIPDGVSTVDSLSTVVTLRFDSRESFIADIYAKVRVYQAKEKEKKKVVKPFLIPLSSLSTGQRIDLPVLDATKVISARFASQSILEDITLFPNKTKEGYYNSYLVFNGLPFSNTSSTLELDLEFFQRGPSNGFFSVDSYEDYDSIPEEKIQNENFKINSTIDFRVDILDGQIESAYIPIPDETFECSYSFYLSRIDKLVATSSKNFEIIRGISSQNPVPPRDSPLAMTLYTLSLSPYSSSPSSVKVKFHENKRYTMRDIGKLEKRIENLEYYTALSLLEKETKDMEILDENGNSRYKNGFLVDNFKSFKSVDFASKENTCSLDLKEGVLRPSFKMDYINVLYNPYASYSRRTGDLITVPYSEVPFIEQLKCSESINLQPFEVFNYEGKVSLFPEIDEWVDTETAPSVIANQFGETDIWEQIGTKAFSTVWNSWETNILSVPETTNLSSIEHTSPDKITSASIKKLWNPSVDSKVDQELLNTYKTWVDSNFTSGFSKTSPDGYVDNQPAIYLDFKGEKTDSVRSGSISAFSKSKIITNETTSSVKDVSVVSFMRGKEIKFSAKNLKPSTRFYCFFGTENVTDSISPSILMTDSLGKVEGTFNLPGGKFKCGTYSFTLRDSLSIQDVDSFAETKYRAEGLKQTKQSTIISSREPVIISLSIKEEKSSSSISWSVSEDLILPTPTQTPTPTPTPTQTPTQTPTPTSTQIATGTPTPTPTSTVTPSLTPSGTKTQTPTVTPTPTISLTPGTTWTPTPTPTVTPTSSFIPTPTPTPSELPPFEVYFVFAPFFSFPRTNPKTGTMTFSTSLGQNLTIDLATEKFNIFNNGDNGNYLFGPFVIPRSTVSVSCETTISGANMTFELSVPPNSNREIESGGSFIDASGYHFNPKTKTCSSTSVTHEFQIYYNQPKMNPPAVEYIQTRPFNWLTDSDKNKNIIFFQPVLNYIPQTIAPSPSPLYIPPSQPAYNPPYEPPYSPPPSPIPGVTVTPTKTPIIPSQIIPIVSPSPQPFVCPPISVEWLSQSSSGSGVVSGVATAVVHSGGKAWSITNISSNAKVRISPMSGKDGEKFTLKVIFSLSGGTEETTSGTAEWTIEVTSECGSKTSTNGSISATGEIVDPLAQSFSVEEKENPEGIFLSSVDLFFKSKAENSIVEFEIRPSVNGYPSSKEKIPFSEVSKSSSDILVSDDASKATTFKFHSPLYLKPAEYHFVVKARDTKTKAWIATLGQFELGSQEKRISKNPYSGVLLKSANASTWIPQSESDLKFRLNRCSFDTSSSFMASLELSPYFGTENVETPKEFSTLRLNVPSLQPKETYISSASLTLFDKDYLKTTKIINLNENVELPKSFYLKDMRGVIPSVLDANLLSSKEKDLTDESNLFYETSSVVNGNSYLSSSLPFSVILSTKKETVSPILDIQKMSATIIKNIISFPSDEDLLFEENASGGKAKARYITKPVKLNSSIMANRLYISFAALIPEDTSSEVNIKVYYKIYNSLKNSDDLFSSKKWTLLGDSAEKGSKSSSFVDFEFQTESLVYDGNYNITDFDWFSVKLVLLSKNSAFIPKVKDFRVIALSA